MLLNLQTFSELLPSQRTQVLRLLPTPAHRVLKSLYISVLDLLSSHFAVIVILFALIVKFSHFGCISYSSINEVEVFFFFMQKENSRHQLLLL